ncbi:transcriptional regulator [Acinetobacter baumannii]
MSRRLNETDALGVGDQFVLYKGNCTDFRSVPQDIIIRWVIDNIPKVNPVAATVQLFNPNADFNLQVDNNTNGTYLVINPSVTINNGTITLPQISDVTDGQSLFVTSSKQITNLTFMPNGAALVGQPITIGISGFFKLQFDKTSQTWYRVG